MYFKLAMASRRAAFNGNTSLIATFSSFYFISLSGQNFTTWSSDDAAIWWLELCNVINFLYVTEFQAFTLLTLLSILRITHSLYTYIPSFHPVLSRWPWSTNKSVRTSLGARSFCVASVKIWNSPPPALRSCNCADTFRRHLKTHCFQQAFFVPL